MAMSAVERAYEARKRFERMSDYLPGVLPSLGAGNHPRYELNGLSKGALIDGGFTREVVCSLRNMHRSGIGDAETRHVPPNAQDDLHVRLHTAEAVSGRLPSVAR